MRRLRRDLWLALDYAARALLRALDHIGAPRSERGE